MRPDYQKALRNAEKSIFEANLTTMMKRMTPADRAALYHELTDPEKVSDELGTFEISED